VVRKALSTRQFAGRSRYGLVVRSRWQGGLAGAVVTLEACVLVMTQANRASQAVSEVLAGSGDRDAAVDEFRTYTMMLLAVAPVLIDNKITRNFLERAQHLDGEMALALTVLTGAPRQGKFSATRFDHALQGLKSASTPLLQNLNPDMQSAVRGDDPA
jgi:hypothetical protein